MEDLRNPAVQKWFLTLLFPSAATTYFIPEPIFPQMLINNTWLQCSKAPTISEILEYTISP